MGNRSRPVQTFQGAEEANEFMLQVDIADLSADTSHFVVSPCQAEIVAIRSVIDGAVAAADVVITPKIAGVAVAGGVVTITQAGSAAGDVDEAIPTGANVVAQAQAVELAVTGGGAGGSPRGHVILTMRRIGKASN